MRIIPARDRVNSRTPSWLSSCLISAGWDTNSRVAARVRLPSAATAAKESLFGRGASFGPSAATTNSSFTWVVVAGDGHQNHRARGLSILGIAPLCLGECVPSLGAGLHPIANA